MRSWILAFWMCVAWTSGVQAHTLDVATARVTLRDGQVAVTAHIDVLALMQTLKKTDDVPLGLLAVVDPEVFDALAHDAWGTLRTETTLTVDGTSIRSADWQFPNLDNLRAEAQRQWMAQAVEGHPHATFSRVSFEAKVARPPKTVEVALPHAVGPVLMSFVQPLSQLAEAGSAVTIPVPTQSLSLVPSSTPPDHDEAP